MGKIDQLHLDKCLSDKDPWSIQTTVKNLRHVENIPKEYLQYIFCNVNCKLICNKGVQNVYVYTRLNADKRRQRLYITMIKS